MTNYHKQKQKEYSPFLGVACSVTNRCWMHKTVDEEHTLMMSRKIGLPSLVTQILIRRGILEDTVDTYLEPKLKHALPDPFSLNDMDKAAKRLASAIIHSEVVAILGDYDVDGATSSALMKHFIESMGGTTILYIPDRIKEGYGPNTTALQQLKAAGATVVVIVDCGTLAFTPISNAMASNLDVIVVDHHKSDCKLPSALAIVNPNRFDEVNSHGYLAAVGVTFLVIVAINRILRESGWCIGNTENLVQWLDLVALGTVCDMVPLIGINRALVTQGIKVMRKNRNVGLNALSRVSGLHVPYNIKHLGFVLGPRINAGGRVGQPDLGAKLLSTNDQNEALALAYLLESYNKNRRIIEKQVLLDVMAQTTGTIHEMPVIFIAGLHWHPGVIGIIASRLKEYYGRPSCVATIEGSLVKGSCRSISHVDIGTAILVARNIGLLETGGGHAMAAGFTVQTKNLWVFRNFLVSFLTEKYVIPCTPTLWLDGIIDPVNADALLGSFLCRLEPFGPGNQEPCFAVANVRITQPRVINTEHILCNLVNSSGSCLRAISFRSTPSNLGEVLLTNNGILMHVAGTLHYKSWKKYDIPQLIIEDIAYA